MSNKMEDIFKETQGYIPEYLFTTVPEISGVFYKISKEKCDVIRTLDFYLNSSVFDEIHKRANPKYLNMSSRQHIECISFDDGFNWWETQPVKDEYGEDTYDEYIMEWVGTILTYFQWAYNIDFHDWLKYFSVKDIYYKYYPLHECGYIVTVQKLKEMYDYAIEHKEFRIQPEK